MQERASKLAIMDVNSAGFKIFQISALQMTKGMHSTCLLDFKDMHYDA